MERLQKVIAQCGVASRRKAEELILSGRVKVDDVVVDTLGFKVSCDSVIKVDDNVINKEEKVVYIINKPKNIISSVKDEKGRDTVIDLVDSPYRLFPVGRLDFDSSGLLILTNDGELTNMIIHPRYKIPKVYEVTINGLITLDEIKTLENGIRVDDYVTSKARIVLVSSNNNKKTSHMTMTIFEGHNRQIRKMFETLGYTVTRLHRIKEANIEIGNLKPGAYRRLKPFEVVSLKRYLNNGE
ncbi:MAG: pseudouridine synthase [Firmicutes bacterium]|nr:pseudouridine synthase [Bacillota bacterium]MDY3092229.1 pseudouridine synthase [Erysipelotrichaceae bacterium]